MGISWTSEQKQVIELQNRNILVSAAAGSGKTAVLVERIIQMLIREKDPVSVDELLIVTFTEAAAAEMKERIRVAIEKKLEEFPEDEHLNEQATLIHNAMITTIHSFCLSVIRDHFHDIDLDPGFRVGEEGEMQLLRYDVLDEMLEDCYQEGSKEFLDFVNSYATGKNDKKIEEYILQLYDFSRSYPDSEGWLDGCIAAYDLKAGEPLENSAFVQHVLESSRRNLKDARSMIENAMLICGEEDGPYFYMPTMEADLQLIDTFLSKHTYNELYDAVRTLSFDRLKAKPKKFEGDENKIEQVKDIRGKAKKFVSDMKDKYVYLSEKGLRENLNKCQASVAELARLTKLFAIKFEETKRNQNVIDFSDMEQYALRILTEKKDGGLVPSVSAREYQKQFREVMIDEYQDSNDIQEAILTSVSTVSEGKNNVFMVGDVKQSIYRFRMARPELFMEKYKTYSSEESETQRIDLPKNFRSRQEVVDSVNFFFRQLMTPALGGITYDENAALHVGASYPEGEGFGTEVHFIEQSDEIDKKHLEAKMVAQKIKDLVGKQMVTDKETGQFRPARYRDIVILLRSTANTAEIYQEELEEEEIPNYTASQEGYFNTKEIRLVLNYLRILDNFRQDIPLAAVLASPMGKISDEELALIRCIKKEAYFYDAVETYRESGEDEKLKGKLEAFFTSLEEIREVVPYTPMHELLEIVLKTTGYRNYVAAKRNGSQGLANLDMLKERASSYEKTSYKGLFHFVRYIEKLEKYSVDYGEVGLDDEASDVVRIMTIHKSKGLEFPIVFVSSSSKNFNLMDANGTVVLNSKLGIGIDSVDLEHRVKTDGLAKKIIADTERNDTRAEELRVLYVALTRAKEKLIITGVVDSIENAQEKYIELKNRKEIEIPFYALTNAKSYTDWILASLQTPLGETAISVNFYPASILDLEKEKEARVLLGELESFKLMDVEKEYDGELKAHLQEQFSYEYPYADCLKQRQKYSVSELKHRRYEELLAEEQSDAMQMYPAMDEDLKMSQNIVESDSEADGISDAPVPQFIRKSEGNVAAQRGTNYHRVLELLDFRKNYSSEELKEKMIFWEKENLLEEGAVATIRLADMMDFLHSEVAIRMGEAEKKGLLYKEQPFVYGVPASTFSTEFSASELSLVQGIIDVFFEENGELVLLDYKTDRVKEEGELLKRYKLQLDIYAEALEQLTGKKVKEKLIYAFALKKTISL